MGMNAVIQGLSLLVSNSSLEQPRSIKDLQAELRSSDTRLRAMKTIVSMMQQNYDMGILYGDVLKIIDTSNPELKILCNVYLKSTCADRPACQLMCTHIFLKDFNDRNWMIQRLAVNDAVQLADEIIIKSYINDIRRMCTHEKKEIRTATARCMSLFYLKDRNMLFQENLAKHLKDLLNDSEDDVAIAAAKSISFIESKEDIVSMEDVCKIVVRFVEKRNYQGIRAALEIGKHKRLTDQARHMLLKLIHCSDICIFYLSSMKLLENDKSLYQLVYDIAMGFMTSRPEQLYNLLVYIDSFFDKVDSDSRDFVILHNDPDYIKDMKIKLLIRKYDGFAEHEIGRLIKRGERVLQVLDYALEFNVEIEGIFECITPEQCDQSLRIIHEHLLQKSAKSTQPVGTESAWDTAITNYLSSIKTGVGKAHIYIELCGRFCRSIPALISKLESESNSAHILKFYCLMMNRGIINEQQCLSYLENFRRIVPHMPRVKLVMKHISRVDAEDIYESSSRAANKRSTNGVDFPIEKGCEDGVLHDRPFQSCEHGIDKQKDIHSMSMQDTSYAPRSDTSANESRTIAESMPVYIDTRMFKGTLDIIDSKMVLTVDILEESQSIRYGLHRASGEKSDAPEFCSEISSEGRYTLFAVKSIHLGSIFRFEIGSMVFDVEIDVCKMIRPLRCDLKTFESCFSKAKGSISIGMLNTCHSFDVGDNCYAFKVFDQNVFAKKLEKFVTLRGEPETLEKFK